MSIAVEIDLLANDLVSPVLHRIRRNLYTDLAGGANTAGGAMGGILGAGSPWANAALGAIDTLKQAFGQFYGWLSDSFKEAADFEVRSSNAAVGIKAASELSGATGISLTRARELTKELEKQASLSAMALPGETSDYAKTSQYIADTVAQTYNLSTEEGLKSFKETMKNLSEGIGFVAATSTGSGAEAVNRAFEGFLTGNKSLSALKRYDDVATSPLFRVLEDITNAKGIKDVKKISTKERVDLLLEAKQKALSPEIIAMYQDTAEGMMSSIKSMFFDLQVGAFGVMRQVESEGDRSAFDAFKDLLRTTLVLISDVQKIGQSLGVSLDPMKILIRGIDWVNDLLVQVSLYVEKFTPGKLNLGISDDWAVNLMKWNRFLLNSIADVFYNINWGGVGEFLGNIIGQGFIGLLRLMTDPGTWVAFVRVLDSISWGILKLVGGLIKGLFTGIFEQLKAGFASDFKNLMKFFEAPIEAIGRFNRYLASQFKRLQDFFSDVFSGVSSAIANLINMFKNPVQSIGGWISGALNPLNDFVKSLVDKLTAILDKIPKLSLPKLNIPGFGNQNKPEKPAGNKPEKPVTSKPAQAQPVGKPLATPAGTVVKPLSTGGGNKPENTATNKNNTYNVNINAGTNATPEDIAGHVMAAISGKYSTYKQGAMA